MTRPTIESLDGQDYDVAVIGVGAVGASSAQHMAARGYRVVMVDKGDIASGTSSRSSRLLYCGLAYFSPDYPIWQFLLHPLDLVSRVRMAWLAMQCRSELVRTMPERLTQHTFFFPVYEDGNYPGWKVDLGFRALSLFASRRAPLAYRRLSAGKAAERYGLIDHLDRTRLRSVAVFREYQYCWAERIIADTAFDAERMGATLRTYATVSDLRREDGGWRLTLQENAPGASGSATLRARMVVNAAGPWVDRVTALVSNSARPRQTGIKGINLLVRLPNSFRGQGLETVSSRKEPYYLMPWGDYHFFGPTETVFKDDADRVRVEKDELHYVLGEASRLFPGLNLCEEDVIYRWAGVRPHTNAKKGFGVRTVTVHDMADDGLDGMLTVTGCPIMVHRYAGRAVASKVAERLSPSGQARPLNYGARLVPAGIRSDSGTTDEEILHVARSEHVVTLSDLMQRRLPTGWQGDMGLAEAEHICSVAAPALGWNAERQAQECARYRAEMQEHFQPLMTPKPVSDDAPHPTSRPHETRLHRG